MTAHEHPVVACYRGPDSADAVQLGALLASALGEPLVLASAYAYEPVGMGAAARPQPDNERRADAARASLRRARDFVITDVDVREDVVPSVGVGTALIELARDHDACLMVLGRDTRGRVTRSLVPRAPCPVAVAPFSVPLPRAAPRRVGVAYDGSPTAQWALVAATHLAVRTGARLVLLAVGASAEHAATWLHVARLSLGRKLDHEELALVGDPAATLAAHSDGLDLLLCGSRGRGRPLAALLGSVSGHLVEHARCPVVVVPPCVWRNNGGPLGITSAAANG